MPFGAPRVCKCGRTVPCGQKCVDCERIRKRAVETRRPMAAHRGYGRDWQKAAKEFLARPENRRCATSGCERKVCTVDHRKPHKGDGRVFWDRSNWQPMCWPCHSRKTAARDGGFGNPVKAETRNKMLESFELVEKDRDPAGGVSRVQNNPPGARAAQDPSRAIDSNSAPSLGIGR